MEQKAKNEKKLVISEDSYIRKELDGKRNAPFSFTENEIREEFGLMKDCLLYTSDAADE